MKTKKTLLEILSGMFRHFCRRKVHTWAERRRVAEHKLKFWLEMEQKSITLLQVVRRRYNNNE